MAGRLRQRARALRRLGHPKEALRTLHGPLRRGDLAGAFRNLNEIAALESFLRRHRRAEALDAFLISLARLRRRRDLELTSRARWVQRRSIAVHLRAARKDADRQWTLTTAGQPVGLGNSIDAATWAADVLKMQGDFDEARRRLLIATERAPYGNPAQAVLLRWKIAEIDLLRGAPRDEVMDALITLVGQSESSPDPRWTGWVRATLADASRTVDPTEAATLLGKVVAGDSFLDTYAALIQAALSLQTADHAGLSEALADAHRSATSRTLPLPSGALALRLIQCVALAGDDPDKAEVAANQLAAEFRKRGMTTSADHAPFTARAARARDPDLLREAAARPILM